MPLLSKDRNRDRLVIFRVSQDEYESLRSACVAANGRSISDYMRSELLSRVAARAGAAGDAGAAESVTAKFTEIDRKLEDLRDLLEQVSQRIS